MKKTLNNIVLLIILFSALACSEKDIMIYENDPRISLEIPGTGDLLFKDSLVYSFPTRMDNREEDTLWFNASVIGLAATYDREVSITANPEGTTAKENTHYKISPVILPADSFTVKVPVVIFRTEDIKTQSVRLELDVRPNKDFKIGYGDRTKVILVWGDFFLKPDIWDQSNYLPCFGQYTSTRYKFILSATRLYELPDPSAYSTLGVLNLIVREALYRYNQEHSEPLKDELGEVSFPVWGGASAG